MSTSIGRGLYVVHLFPPPPPQTRPIPRPPSPTPRTTTLQLTIVFHAQLKLVAMVATSLSMMVASNKAAASVIVDTPNGMDIVVSLLRTNEPSVDSQV